MGRLSQIVKAYDVRGLVGDRARRDGRPRARRRLRRRSWPARGAGTTRPVVVAHDMRASSPGLAAAFADGVPVHGRDVVQAGPGQHRRALLRQRRAGRARRDVHRQPQPRRSTTASSCAARAPAGRPGHRPGAAPRPRRAALARRPAGGPPAGAPAGRRASPSATCSPTTPRYLRGLVDLSGIRPLTVVVDAGNGMAGLTTPAVLGTAAGLPALPIEIVPLYFELDGTFPNHEANPLDPANLRDLQAAVAAHGADIGLAFDGDADRCFVVDERGRAGVARAPSPRWWPPARSPRSAPPAGTPTVIHNLITSRAVPEIDRRRRRPAACAPASGTPSSRPRWPATGAVFGGEHSAHYYFRDFWFADTGMLAALHVLAALGGQDRPLSELVARYERYVASGEINSRVDDVDAAIAAVEAAFAERDDVVRDRLDGLDGLLGGHGPADARCGGSTCGRSNTEPLLRLNAEAVDAADDGPVRDQVLALVRAG